MKMKLFKKGDIIVAAAVLVLCAALFLALYVFNNNKGNFVQIEQNGNVIHTMPLDIDAVYYVKTSGEVTNTVEVKNGSVSVTYADCPDQICVNHAPINLSGESIICLPNKVVVSVVEANGNVINEIDGVAR